jgi:hypothetical protein
MQARYLALLSLVFLSFEVAFAKQFKNAYISFEIPDRWNCILEATEWVCRSQESNESKEAIIVLTAKEAGANDSIVIYENYMKNPIQATTKTGSKINSQVMSPPSQKRINNLTWIDGFHISSEIQNYYTRYMATIKDGKIAVLVTFSSHKEFYTKYTADFFKAIDSLNVYATKASLAQNTAPINPGGLSPIAPLPVSDPIVPLASNVQKPNKNNKLLMIVAAVALGLIGIFLLMKKK